MVFFEENISIDGLATADCAERALLARGWPGLAKGKKRGNRARIFGFPVTESREIAGFWNMARGVLKTRPRAEGGEIFTA